jgi:hypothetical protein
LRRLGEPQDAAWSLPTGALDHATHEYLRRTSETLTRLGVPQQYPGDTPQPDETCGSS